MPSIKTILFNSVIQMIQVVLNDPCVQNPLQKLPDLLQFCLPDNCVS